MVETSKEDRIAYGIEMTTSLMELLENDLSEAVLGLMNNLSQLMAAEVTASPPSIEPE